MVLGLAAGAAAPAAEGSRLIGTGPQQLAAAGAGVASPLDSTWLSINAAGLIEVGHRIDTGFEILAAAVELEAEGVLANPVGRQKDDVVVVAPHLTWARPVQDGDAAIGLGFYTVSGLNVEWNEPRSVFGTTDDYDRYAEIGVARLSAAYARRVSPDTSLGIALNVNYMTLASDIFTASGAETAGGGEEDRSFGAGFQLSLLHRVGEVAIGLSYTSRQWMQTLEDYDDALIAPLDQPQTIQLGFAWTLSPEWELLTDYRFIDWSSVRAVADEQRAFGWEDQHVLKLAARYRPAEAWLLTGGVSYARSQIRDEDVFANGLSVLISEWHLTAGCSWRATERWELQSSLLWAPREERTDDGSKFGGAGEGTTIALEVFSLGLGLGYRF